MQIWPAIDLRGGRCVRLQQGDYDRETAFADDPVPIAERWVREGARQLHLVDLDGARAGRPVNESVVRRIVSSVPVPCQLGGGVRDQQSIDAWFSAGVARLVIGTQAVKEPEWFCTMAERYPGRLALGIDAREGQVATDGWLATSCLQAVSLAQQLDYLPLAAIVYTDIQRDGMLAGPNYAALAQMRSATRLPVIASGGVSSPQDVRQLARLELAGCIIGRALYENRITLADALAAAAAARP